MYAIGLLFFLKCRYRVALCRQLRTCRSLDDPRVLFVPRASCGHGQRLPEPAVWFQGVLSLWRVILPTTDSPKMAPHTSLNPTPTLLFALYPGNNTSCRVLCQFKMFQDETLILPLLFPFQSHRMEKPLKRKRGDDEYVYKMCILLIFFF